MRLIGNSLRSSATATAAVAEPSAPVGSTPTAGTPGMPVTAAGPVPPVTAAGPVPAVPRQRAVAVGPEGWRPRGRVSRRLTQLVAGLILYGMSMALMIRSQLGLDPWDVFHQGVALRTGLSFGAVVIITGVAVLLGWIPLRQRPGIGTVLNAILIGVAVEATLVVLPAARVMWLRVAFLVAGIVLNGVATGAYIGARLGPGPRDGLMTGYAARFRTSIRVVRTVIEVTVLVTGWLLGGRVGAGTVLYAVSIGPLAHVFIPLLTVRPHRGGRR